MKYSYLLLGLLMSVSLHAQVELGMFGGISTYSGDMTENVGVAITTSSTAYGAFFRVNHGKYFSTKMSLYTGSVQGSDANFSDIGHKRRNLNFESPIVEFAITPEVNIYPIRLSNGSTITPFAYIGVAGFYFNPTTVYNGSVVELQPLGTEGQGLPGYPERYSRFNLSIPFGGGLKYSISELVNIGLDWGLRPTFTDHLDDLSTLYAPTDLLSEHNGLMSALLSDRTSEFTGVPSLVEPGQPRGSDVTADWYFMGGVYISFNLGRSNKTNFADF